jgi:hypothetical protein
MTGLPRRLSLSLCAALALAGCLGVSTGQSPPAPAPPTEEPPAQTPSQSGLSPDLPSDIPADPDQTKVDEFSWQSFVALNWPALPGQRGVADPSKTIGQPGEVVWETYKRPGEVFLPGGQPPPPWNAPPASIPPACRQAGAAAGAKLLLMDAKASDPLKSVKQAVGGTLTDQHGNLARYEILFGRTEFDYIVGNRFYDATVQAQAKQIDFTPGSVEVKAAWREMTAQDSPQVRQRFYVTKAWIFDDGEGTGRASCRLADVGLVGLHIIQKTPSAPQWIWSTFEQIDNVNDPGSGSPLSFYNPGCPIDECIPNTSTEKDGKPTGIPTQVVRENLITNATRAINQTWQARLAAAVQGSPWQYYQLVSTQWPTAPGDPAAIMGNPQPNILANTTMETYIQLDSSCIGCHSTSTTVNRGPKADFSFVLLHAQAAPAQGGASR